MTFFEKTVLTLLEAIETHLANLVGDEASTRGTVRDDADAANEWARVAKRIRERAVLGAVPFMQGYVELHEELERACAAGSLNGGVFGDAAPMTSVRAVQIVAQVARKCSCGRANRCAFPTGLCPGERAKQDSVVSLVAETIMFPKLGRVPPEDLAAKPYDVISRASIECDGAKDICECGHTRRMHVAFPSGCIARANHEQICECSEFRLVKRVGSNE